MEHNEVFLLGYASSIGGRLPGAAKAPKKLRESQFFSERLSQQLSLRWQPPVEAPAVFSDRVQVTADLCGQLSRRVASLVRENRFFVVLGGDHSCATGTWGGVVTGLREKAADAGSEACGLIWIDAHMDSHTPETTPSGNLHGMPLAILMGYGYPALTNVSGFSPVLLPKHVCLVGVRSYEAGEVDLLNRLGVRVFYMEEVRSRGLAAVLEEARHIVTRGTAGYGISLDIDSIDPEDAPGTGVPEPHGISAREMCRSLTLFAGDLRLKGVEITEFDPDRDQDTITEKLVPALIEAIITGQPQTGYGK